MSKSSPAFRERRHSSCHGCGRSGSPLTVGTPAMACARRRARARAGGGAAAKSVQELQLQQQPAAAAGRGLAARTAAARGCTSAAPPQRSQRACASPGARVFCFALRGAKRQAEENGPLGTPAPRRGLPRRARPPAARCSACAACSCGAAAAQHTPRHDESRLVVMRTRANRWAQRDGHNSDAGTIAPRRFCARAAAAYLLPAVMRRQQRMRTAAPPGMPVTQAQAAWLRRSRVTCRPPARMRQPLPVHCVRWHDAGVTAACSCASTQRSPGAAVTAAAWSAPSAARRARNEGFGPLRRGGGSAHAPPLFRGLKQLQLQRR
jgi:hypothetical protein